MTYNDNNTLEVLPIQVGRKEKIFTYDYMNKDILQKDGTVKKEISQSHFDAQQQKWVLGGGKEPFPPYNLLELLARPDADVLVVEGEKTVEAAKKLFPNMVVTTSAGGSNSAHKTDFSPLKGRRVIICPDFDAPSTKYGDDVTGLCHKAGAKSIYYLPVQDLVRHFLKNVEIERGDDLADARDQGLTSETIAEKGIESFLIPVEGTISEIIQDRFPNSFKNKTKEFKKLKSNALKQNKENQQNLEELEQKKTGLKTEVEAAREEIRKNNQELPKLTDEANQLNETYLETNNDPIAKAAFNKADEKRLVCKRSIDSKGKIIRINEREITKIDAEISSLKKKIKTDEEIEANLLNRLTESFQLYCSNSYVSGQIPDEWEAIFKRLKDKQPDLFAELEVLIKDENLLLDSKNKTTDNIPPPTGFETELARLASLSVPEYEQQRKKAADSLGFRTSVLDEEVNKLKSQPDIFNQGDMSATEMFPVVEPWGTSVKAEDLLNEIKNTLRKFVILPEHADIAIALWIVFTYFIDEVQVSPILAISSPEKQCGKTTVLSIVINLSLRALPASNISPACVFRSIELWNPTLIIDEGDTFIAESDELRGILNSGHTRSTAYVIRAVEWGMTIRPHNSIHGVPKQLPLSATYQIPCMIGQSSFL